MDPNELLKLLDLKAKPPPADALSGPAASPESSAVLQSPTALEVDEWELRRGRDLVAESERLRKSGTDAFAAADFFGPPTSRRSSAPPASPTPTPSESVAATNRTPCCGASTS